MVNIVGENIRNARRNKKLTQKDLATRIKEKFNLEIGQSAISQYEKGIINISYDMLLKLADVLDISINNLMGITEKAVIIQSETVISNRLVMESTYRLLVEVLKHHDELSKISLTADEIINADNCYWELLVPDVINAIKNSVTRFAWREDHGKLEPRQEEVKINLGKLKTQYDNGPALSGAIKSVPLSKLDTDKNYLKFKLDEIKTKLDALNSTEKKIPNDLPGK